MATQKFSSAMRAIRAARLEVRGLVGAGGVRPGVLPAGFGKTAVEKNFEEYSWKPEDAVFFPLGCHTRMMD